LRSIAGRHATEIAAWGNGAFPGEVAILADSGRVGENVGVFSGRPEFVQDTASKFWNFLYSKWTNPVSY